MKKAIATIAAIMSLLLIPLTVHADTGIQVVDRIGDGTWTGNTWKVSIYPGEVKSTVLTLYNLSADQLDVEITIEPDSLDSGNLVFELDRSSFSVPSSWYMDFTLTVRAGGDATPGDYKTELEIKSEVPVVTPAPGGGSSGGGTSSTPVPTATPEPTIEPTPTITPTPIETPAVTATPTPVITPTPTPTAGPKVTPTLTPILPTATPIPGATPSPSPVPEVGDDNKPWIWLGIGIAAAFGIIFIGILYNARKRRKEATQP